MSKELETIAREWYEKTYPLTAATSNRQYCEEDVIMCAAFAAHVLAQQPPAGQITVDSEIIVALDELLKLKGISERKRIGTATPEEWNYYQLQCEAIWVYIRECRSRVPAPPTK